MAYVFERTYLYIKYFLSFASYSLCLLFCLTDVSLASFLVARAIIKILMINAGNHGQERKHGRVDMLTIKLRA